MNSSIDNEIQNNIKEQITYQNKMLESINNNINSIKLWISIIGFFYVCKMFIIVMGITISIQSGTKLSEMIEKLCNYF